MKRIPRIDLDTPLVPGAVARAVCEEVTVWLDEPLPRRWLRELTGRANTVYAHNAHFRKTIRGEGARGRDLLWTFMRHWLSGLLWEHRRHLYNRLPSDYRVGCPLPAKPAGHVANAKRKPKLTRGSLISAKLPSNAKPHLNLFGEFSLNLTSNIYAKHC